VTAGKLVLKPWRIRAYLAKRGLRKQTEQLLYVETLGADGEHPDVLEQYDIENMEQNTTDIKA
jgi:hypothetical protein